MKRGDGKDGNGPKDSRSSVSCCFLPAESLQNKAHRYASIRQRKIQKHIAVSEQV